MSEENVSPGPALPWLGWYHHQVLIRRWHSLVHPQASLCLAQALVTGTEQGKGSKGAARRWHAQGHLLGHPT